MSAEKSEEEFKNRDDSIKNNDENIIIEQFNESDWFDNVKKYKNFNHKKNIHYKKKKKKLDSQNSKIYLDEKKSNEYLVKNNNFRKNYFRNYNYNKNTIEEEKIEHDNSILLEKVKNSNKVINLKSFNNNIPKLYSNNNTLNERNQLFNRFPNKLKKNFSISNFQNNKNRINQFFDEETFIHKNNNESITPSKIKYKNYFRLNNTNNQDIENNKDLSKQNMSHIFHRKLFRVKSLRPYKNDSFLKLNRYNSNSFNNEFSYCELPYIHKNKYLPYINIENSILRNNNNDLSGNYKRNISGIYDIPKRTLKLKI